MNQLFQIMVYLFLSLSYLCSSSLENYETYFRQAEKCYEDKKYEQAIQKYQLLLDKDYENDVIFYNLGVALVFAKKYGAAIWAFKKAKQYHRTDRQIRDNLAYLYKRLDLGEMTQMNIVSFMFFQFIDLFSINMWIFLFLLSYIFLVSYIFRRKYFKKHFAVVIKWCVWGGASLFFLTCISLCFHLQPFFLKERGVIVLPKIHLKSEPSPQSLDVVVLKEGCTCPILNRNGDWVEIQTPHLDKGWIPVDVLKKL